jgi:proteasome assembly chaperone (PAC2) family protein
MADEKPKLTHPWLVAVWPGMGHVALNAGYYLLAKLDMALLDELEANDLFDVDHVDVKAGRIQPARRPRNRFFVRRDPAGRHDLVVFLGEALPPVGWFAFCKQLVAFARDLGVERVVTFAAMATRMHPEHRPRVFGAATDDAGLQELKRLEVEPLEEGHIGGLNGVLLGAAAEAGLPGACLLGEMSHLFAQLPFPKASLGVLEVFAPLAGLDLDLTALAEQAKAVEDQFGELLARVEEAYGGNREQSSEREEGRTTAEPERPTLSAAQRRRVEGLFGEAAKDRAKAFELKGELDRLGVFAEYEDRFLDLFRKPN